MLVREGGNGNVAAIKEVGDRLDAKPAQAVAITGDPDSPVIFNLRLGDGLKTIEHEPTPEALTAPLVAISGTSSTRDRSNNRLAEMRFAPRSYFCICWKVRPSGSNLTLGTLVIAADRRNSALS